MCCDPVVPRGNWIGACTGRENPHQAYGCVFCGSVLWGHQVADHFRRCGLQEPELEPGYPFEYRDPFD